MVAYAKNIDKVRWMTQLPAWRCLGTAQKPSIYMLSWLVGLTLAARASQSSMRGLDKSGYPPMRAALSRKLLHAPTARSRSTPASTNASVRPSCVVQQVVCGARGPCLEE